MLLYSKVRFYAPNDQNQQITVFKKMINSIRCRQTVKILIGGDSNFPLSASDKFSEKQAVIIYIELWSSRFLEETTPTCLEKQLRENQMWTGFLAHLKTTERY